MMDRIVTLRRGTALALVVVAAELAGCSALQVDVDVYKGALNNERDVQTRQFAALVMAAKPVLANARNEMHTQNADGISVGSQASSGFGPGRARSGPDEAVAQSCDTASQRIGMAQDAAQLAEKQPERGVTFLGSEKFRYSYRIESANQAAFFINGLLSYYEPRDCVNPLDDWHRARGEKGLIELFNALTQAEGLTNPASRNMAREEALRKLTAALIPFAERILFVANNTALFKGQENLPERAILQNLGNSLILHANDLRRREVHDQSQAQRFEGQVRAAVQATDSGANAATVLQRFEDEAKRQATLAEDKLSKAKAAVAAAEAASAAATTRVTSATAANATAGKAATDWKLSRPQTAIKRAHDTLVSNDAAQDKPAAQQDLAAADEAVTKAFAAQTASNTTVTARAVATEVQKWAATNSGSSAAGSERQQRLEAVASVLDEKAPAIELQPLAAGKPAQVWDRIKSALAAARDKDLREEATVRAEAARANAALNKANAAKTAAESALKSANEDKELAQRASATSKEVQEKVSAALPSALAAAKSTTSNHPEALREVLLAQLKESPKATTMVKSVQLLGGFAFDYRRADTHDPKQPQPTSMQVLDDLITHLRTQRVMALAKGQTPEAEHLAAAVEAAEQQRSDQAFLRPASDYLRDVFSSTALQADGTEPNRNMLLDYLRTLKFGRATENTPKTVLEARAELEKLFWQNINRVTTTGGTNANHVIAKDDVGNWYIKAYSTDPKQVFESAKGLALFNMGGKLDSNLLRRAQLRDDERNGSDEQKKAATAALATMDQQSPANLAVGGRAQERFKTRYKDETLDIAAGLDKRITAMPEGSLRAGWAAHLKADDAEQKALLERLVAVASKRQDDSVRTSLDNLSNDSRNVVNGMQHPSRVGARIVDVLSKLVSYRNHMHDSIAGDEYLAADAQAKLRGQLQKASKDAFNELIDDVAQQRLRSVDTYKEGLESIANVVN
jgi:hypothetical protein